MPIKNNYKARARRSLALLLAAGLLSASAPFALWERPAHAGPLTIPVKNYIGRSGQNAVSLRVDWSNNSLYGVKAARAVWVDRGAGGAPVLMKSPVYSDPVLDAFRLPTGVYRDISQIVISIPDNKFQYDILYQIKIEMYGDAATDPGTGEPLAAPRDEYAETVFLKGITVGARNVESNDTRSAKPGEIEAGHKPAMECSYKMPRVYAPAGGDPYDISPPGAFLRIFGEGPEDGTNPGYAAALGAICRLNPIITNINLVVGIENLIVLTNAYVPLNEIRFLWDQGAGQTAPVTDYAGVVDFRGGETYRAYAMNSGNAADDWYSLYLSGRLNADAAMPNDAAWYGSVSQYVPSEIPPAQYAGVLRHKDVYPGALYRLHAELQYMAGEIDVRESMNSGFEVVGERPARDVETSLRLIISRVADDYAKADIYRINLGKDYVSGNAYKVTVTPDTSSFFGPEMEVAVNDFSGAGDSLQAYIRVSKPTVKYYYQALYTRAGGINSPKSISVPYILQNAGENAAVTPKGLAVEKLEYDPVRKATDVTVSWDRPPNWLTMSADDVYIEFNLNTSYVNSDKPVELLDGEGGAYGGFNAFYRTVLAVRRDEIQTPTNDRLSYTIKGDALFKTVPDAATGVPPPPALPPGDLYGADFWNGQRGVEPPRGGGTLQYPAYLLPNTRYFITLRMALWLDAATKDESDASSAVGFTTYPTVYAVPLPFEFSVTSNPPPSAPQFINTISLRNSNVDWRYASIVYKPPSGPIPVHYELYVSDNPNDAAPQLAGVTNLNPDGTPFASWAADPAWAKNMTLPPPGASDPQGLAAALITGARVASPAGGHISWDNLLRYRGRPLEPNKVYYFWIRTYIIEKHGENGVLTDRFNGGAGFSIMISATTPPLPQDYNDAYKRRVAPVDFAVAADASGNLLVSGETAIFEWSATEADAVYELAFTAVRNVNEFFMPDGSGLPFGDPALAPGLDSTFESFIREFTGDDGRPGDRRLLLDPGVAGLGADAGGVPGFSRDPLTGKYMYRIDRWLFPNSLYFVSLRAVSRDPDPDGIWGGGPGGAAGGASGGTTGGASGGAGAQDHNRTGFYTELKNSSPFVTIPLTTLLLEAPSSLRVITGAELCFSFADDSHYAAADFRIYARGPKQADYAPAGGSQGSVFKASGYVYGTLTSLEFNESYDIRVTRDNQKPEVVYELKGARTRDPYHSVEVEWTGVATAPEEAYLSFEAAIISQTELDELPADQVVYFDLGSSNLQSYKYVKDGRGYPYAIYESAATITAQNVMAYRAVILTKPVRARDGGVSVKPLAPNMRYYVKVRAKKASGGDAGMSAFSKYAGPVEARTDFLQSSQDEIEEKNRIEDNFRGILAEYERETYYIADIGDRSQGKFMLKEDKVVGLLASTPSSGYMIDLSENLKRAGADALYIPGGVLLALQDYGKSLTVRLEGAEYVFARNTIDLRYGKTYADMAKKAGTQAFLVQLRESRSDFAGTAVPAGCEGITQVRRLEAFVIASNRSYANVKAIIDDYVYNEQTGLLNQMLAALAAKAENGATPADAPGGNGAGWQYETEEEQNKAQNAERSGKRSRDAYAAELLGDIRYRVSYRIGDILEGRNGYRTLIADSAAVAEFDAPLTVTLSYAPKSEGKISPFISYDAREWFRLTQNVGQTPGSITFEAIAPGYYSAVLAAIPDGGLPAASEDRAALAKVASRYDLSDIFPGINVAFRPELPVLNREAALLYERVLGLEGATFGMSAQQRINALGLQDIIRAGAQNLQMDRQSAAALLARLYAGMHGLGGGNIAVAGRRAILDAQDIDASRRDAVGFCHEKGLLKLANGKFEPHRPVTRAELINALAAILG